MNRKERRKQEKLNRKKVNVLKKVINLDNPNAIWNMMPTMIHENDFVAHDCSLCGKTVTNIHDSHNAYPLKSHTTAMQVNGKANNDRCCSNCNSQKVISARLGVKPSEMKNVKKMTLTISELIQMMKEGKVA
ncbi:hypothetical protein OAB24_00290 [Gammaproteobacteria bacterium]|nr:hypothetical protein [Gammaproteobacteria bacterium]